MWIGGYWMYSRSRTYNSEINEINELLGGAFYCVSGYPKFLIVRLLVQDTRYID